MTDRELLEYAAKAAGYTHWYWNPLESDGDALRLAVKLRMGVSIPVHKTIRADVVVFTNSSVSVREERGDPYAATRRAIVRAAAEIGKAME